MAGNCEMPHSLFSTDTSEWHRPQCSTATSTSSVPSGPRSMSWRTSFCFAVAATHALMLIICLLVVTKSLLWSPLATVCPAVHVQHFAGHPFGLYQVQHRVSDFINGRNAAHRRQLFHDICRSVLVQRSGHNPWGRSRSPECLVAFCGSPMSPSTRAR